MSKFKLETVEKNLSSTTGSPAGIKPVRAFVLLVLVITLMPVWKVWLFLTRSRVCIQKNPSVQFAKCVKCTQVCMFVRQVALINDKLKLNFKMYN